MTDTLNAQGAAAPMDAVGAAPSERAPRFDDLGLSGDVMAAVRDLGYETPTPVQALAIPEVLAGRDLLAAAQTGTGKTAAFLLPALSTLDHAASRGRGGKGRGPLMLVITPTRELAQQIEEVCLKVAGRTGHVAVTVVGGLSYNPQKSALRRGCDVLVATPGRLVDLIEQGACNLSEVSVLVLDEADRMLDMGFLPAVRKIVAETPDERQTLLFSATLDEQAVGGITDLVRDPARVEIAPATATADTVEQYVLPVSMEAKNALLAQVLEKEGPGRVIVFTRTKHRADACCRRLRRAGISCAPIHGNRSQAQRETALASFRSGAVDVLVATDVLSRGIDVTDVRYVVNFDVPVEPTDYIHRIGRTGRAGELGWALTFVTEQDIDEFFDIEALMGRTAATFDAAGLEVGERPPAIDPDRVPGKAGKRKKTKRGKSTSKKKPSTRRRDAGNRGDGGREEARRAEGDRADGVRRSRARAGEQGGASSPRPARPKRAGRVRVRTETPAPAAEASRGSDHGNWERHDRRARAAAQRDGGSNGVRAGKRPASAKRAGSGKRAGAGARPAAHDWRNSDLASDRRDRMASASVSKGTAARHSKVGRGARGGR